ncbi:NADH-quinone oxidoreductase subunit I, partial [Chloroflexota bacterium]
CGTCINHCPVNPKAIIWRKGTESIPPTYKYDRCIRCYCCQELCPEGAISVSEPILSRALFR